MRYRHVARWVLLAYGMLSACLADTLTLKDGRVLNGTYLGGSARQIRMEVGDSIQTFEIDRVSSIQFGSNSQSPAAPVAEPGPPPRRDRDNVFRPDSPSDTAAPQAGIELPQGTVLSVRMIDPVDSQ